MKKKSLILALIYIFVFLDIYGEITTKNKDSHNNTFSSSQNLDSTLNNILTQILLFPQEKIYMQTDKPYYITGENIFFRIFLLNAFSHQPDSMSRYVYVELINPLDSIIIRQQIRPENGLFYGTIPIPENLAQGNYKLRVYTQFMENIGEDYFFSQFVQIADPQTISILTETKFNFPDDKQIEIGIRFIDSHSKKSFIPAKILTQINGQKEAYFKPDKEGWIFFKANLRSNDKKRVLYTELEHEKYLLKQFIQIPFPEDDFDVSFFPEGGNLLTGSSSKITFKALQSDGQAIDITGEVFDSQNNSVAQFSTFHDGMGYFSLEPKAGEIYHAICSDGKKSIKVKLPGILPDGFALKGAWRQEKFWLGVNKSPTTPWQKLFVVAHTGGMVIYADEWNPEQEFIYFDKKGFPSGVSHILLLTEKWEPLSERLVFSLNNDWISPDINPDKESYGNRELVKLNISLKDIPEANFSISVTDDKEVVIDTTSNILSTILLTSELKGYIHNPAFYFQAENKSAAMAADLLMMTHGWNRYDIPKAMRGDFKYLMIPNEESQSISGIVKGGLLSKPYQGAKVSITSLQWGFLDVTETDNQGRFTFNGFEFPDSTIYTLQALNKKGSNTVELEIDKSSFPISDSYWIVPQEKSIDDPVLLNYITKADLRYTYENGMRMVHLPEVQVRGMKRKEQKEYSAPYYREPDFSISSEEIEKYASSSISALIASRTPGVITDQSGNIVSIKGGRMYSFSRSSGPLIIVDGMESDLSDINIYDIGQIDIVKDMTKTLVFGPKALGGVIYIHTKKFNEKSFDKNVFNIRTEMPLGYSLPVEFYSPQYDTSEMKERKIPDLRSTIYWKPNALFNENNNTSLNFYTADSESTYSIVIEGVTPEGRLIYTCKKALISVE